MYQKRLLWPTIIAAILVVSMGLKSPAVASQKPATVTVMTKNMDEGTDFGFFFANPNTGVQLTLQEVLKNDYPTRASLLAREIAAAKPDIVGLQEVALWTTPYGVIDQLQILLDALAAQGQPYSVVAVNTLTQISFPVAGVTAGYTSRDAMIVRAASAPAIANVQTAIYGALLPLPQLGINVKRGWISADLAVNGRTVRFVTTHLESSDSLYGNPAVNQIQAGQAFELAATFAGSPFPIVIGGDFNSNAAHTPQEQTPSYDIMVQPPFAYVDAWSALHRGVPGFTWPLYLEDPLRQHTEGPFERIDFVFSRTAVPISVSRTGINAPYSSDHAGVLAVFWF